MIWLMDTSCLYRNGIWKRNKPVITKGHVESMIQSIVKNTLRTNLGAIILAIVCVFIVSCDNKKTSTNLEVPKPPPTLANAMLLEVTPMLDGSAYAKSLDSGLWYLRSNKAVRVTVVGSESTRLPSFMEITPVLDGGAYATSWETNFGLWYLRADRAEKVTEVKSLADARELPKISNEAVYALYLAERQKRKVAEERAENPNELDSSAADER